MKRLEEYRRDAWNCYRDSMCKYVFTWHVKSERFSRMCPSLMQYHYDAYCAQGRLDLARALIEDDIDVERSEKLLDVVYRCQLCGGCDYVCGRVKEIQPGRIIQAMRAKLVDDGNAPPTEFRPLMRALREYQNPYEQANAKRAQWLNGLSDCDELTADELTAENLQTDNLLYVGCSPLRDSDAHRLPQTVSKLLSRANFNVGILGSRERCCGNPSLRIGDTTEFIAFARENINHFNKLGIKKLICICPFCYSTFRRDYPQVGLEMGFEVVHILEVIEQLIEQKALLPNRHLDLNVTYHDPCHIGRISSNGVSGTGAFTGLYDTPRNILASLPGVNLVEMERIKDDTLCCGAGSWMQTAYPDFARSTALERLFEAQATSAKALVTHCPHCEENFSHAIRTSESSMKIHNLLELVWQAL